MRYGEKEIRDFDINKKENFWDNKHGKKYKIKITLPEFTCKCPRSGYPDFATIKIEYSPNKKVIELKALKLWINTYADKYISHEDVINEIYDILYKNLKPKRLKVVGDFEPRGNVHTLIKIDSKKV